MKKRRGLSLSEVLMAIGIAAIAILGLASLTVSVWRAAKFAKYTAYASNLARQRLERMRGDSSYLTLAMTGPASERTFTSDFEVDDGQPVKFTGELTFALLPPPQDRYTRVLSRVIWTQQETPRQVTLETILPVP